MTITVDFSATSFGVNDLLDILDFAWSEATITSTLGHDEGTTGINPSYAKGHGRYDGDILKYTALGNNFLIHDSDLRLEVVDGTLNSIRIGSTSTGYVLYSGFDIDMSEFAPIVNADRSGASPTAIEDFLMAQDWNIRLSNQDDIAPRGTTGNDGAVFNLMGNDVIRGLAGNDNLYSGDGNDKLFGNRGDDVLAGGRGDDIIMGGVGNDQVDGNGGHDRLLGGKGRDVIKGGNGGDFLDGGIGRDVLDGGRGSDVLDGGSGTDVITGGGGPDQFIFKDGYGRNRVLDFNANSNNEDIDLRAVTEIINFADLKANHMDQVGEDVVINDGAGTEITLVGVDIADLGKADFLF